MSDGTRERNLATFSTTGAVRQGGWLALVVALLASVVLVALFTYSMSSERQRLEAGVSSQLTSLLGGRVRVVNSWLANEERRERQFAETPSLRIMAAELTSGSVAEGAQYATAIGRFQGLLNNFSSSGGLTAIALVDAGGEVFLSTTAALALPPAVVAAAKATYQSEQNGSLLLALEDGQVGYFRMTAIRSIQPMAGSDQRQVVAVMVTLRRVSEWLSDYLDPGMGVTQGLAFYLLSGSAKGEGMALFTRQGERHLLERATETGFIREHSLAGGEAAVYTLTGKTAAADWALAIEIAATEVDQPLFSYRMTGMVVAGLILLMLVAGLVTFRYRQSREFQTTMTQHYKVAAEKVEAQRRFLDGINAALPGMIGVKNREGRYIYANPSMVAALEKPKEEILGAGDHQLFSTEIAARLEALCQQARQRGRPVQSPEAVALGGGNRFYLFAAAPLNYGADADADAGGGLIIAAEDVTELHKLQVEKEQAADNTIAALVATIEMKDPYLKGQTAFTSHLASGIGEVIGLDDGQRRALRQAALLSQIGKSFIPQELSTRSERLDSEELAEVRQYISRAVEALEPLELAVETISALRDMYERLDGSGFPRGIAGAEVDRLGQVLGIADIITARALPRSNRQPIEAEEAVAVLQEHASRYDPAIVDAAQDYLASDAGVEFITEIRQANMA